LASIIPRMILRALELSLESTQQSLDVSASSWYSAYVSTAHEHQLIRGYGDHTFRPMQVLTIQEGLEMLGNAIKLTGLAALEAPPQDETLVYLTREESAVWIHWLLSKYVLEVDI
jgi:hypothetical protein